MKLYAVTGTVASNGNWNSVSAWSFGRVPANNDTIIIPSSKTVIVNINSPTYANRMLIVHGILFFNNGQKLNFNFSSLVSITNAGLLHGGNPGSKIDMCGTNVWRGPGPDSGPLVYVYNPLPIKHIAFNAVFINEYEEQVNWTTVTEINNDYFIVERSCNGSSFEAVLLQKGARNSVSTINYAAKDMQSYKGVSYYRLRQFDFDGKTSVSSIIAVTNNREKFIVSQPFPNRTTLILI